MWPALQQHSSASLLQDLWHNLDPQLLDKLIYSFNAMVINQIILNKNPLYVILRGNVDKKYSFFFSNRRIIFSKQRVLMEYV